MFFKSPIWELVKNDLRLPTPCAANRVPESENEKWNSWKKNRSEMQFFKNENDYEKKKNTYVVCRDWFDILNNPNINIDSHLIIGWSLCENDDDDDKWFISCAKWETLCLLSRVILINLRLWLRDKNNIEALKDIITCSKQAIKELTEWIDHGNFHEWEESDEMPEEIHFEFFETTRSLAEMLYGFTCLARANTHIEVCGLEYNCVLLSIVLQAECLYEDDNIPLSLQKCVQQICIAVFVSVCKTLFQSAEVLRVLDPPKTVSWNQVTFFFQKAIEHIKKTSCFDAELLSSISSSLEDLQDSSYDAERLNRGFIGEHLNDDAFVPKNIPKIESLRFPFNL